MRARTRHLHRLVVVRAGLVDCVENVQRLRLDLAVRLVQRLAPPAQHVEDRSRRAEREPDQQGGFSGLAPRIMLNLQDLEATGLVRPGSRIEYEILAAGPPAAIDGLESRLDALRDAGVEIRDVRVDRPSLGRSLDRAQKYLSLAGLAAAAQATVRDEKAR